MRENEVRPHFGAGNQATEKRNGCPRAFPEVHCLGQSRRSTGSRVDEQLMNDGVVLEGR
jgi:hypothetical protein